MEATAVGDLRGLGFCVQVFNCLFEDELQAHFRILWTIHALQGPA
jgi:hypothetical protein